MPKDDRIYTEEEIGRVLKRAAEIQGKQPRAGSYGLTLAELRDLAEESGIDPGLVASAALELDMDQQSARNNWWGGPLSTTIVRSVQGPVSDETWEEILSVLRREYEDTGSTEQRGSTRQWSDSSKDGRKAHLIATHRDGWTEFELFWANPAMAIPMYIIPLVFGIIMLPIIFAGSGLTGFVGFGAWLAAMSVAIALVRTGVAAMSGRARDDVRQTADQIIGLAERRNRAASGSKLDASHQTATSNTKDPGPDVHVPDAEFEVPGPELHLPDDESVQSSEQSPEMSPDKSAPRGGQGSGKMRTHPFIRWAVLLVALAPLACTDAVLDPFDNGDRYYTVYGYLDVLKLEHAVRVIPVTRRDPIIRSSDAPNASIDAEVFSTDLLSGVTTRWVHSLEPLSDGTWGHIFRASLRLEQGRSYRLEIIRSDGIRTTAETTIPNFSSSGLIQPEDETIENGSISQDLFIPGIRSPWNIDVIYLWDWKGNHRSFRTYVPYGRPGQRGVDGWHMKIHISDDQPLVAAHMEEVRRSGVLPEGAPLRLRTIGVRIRTLDANWDPPEGVFDADVLRQPASLSNVENGYGFFGSIGLFVQEWNMIHLSTTLGYD